MKWQRGVKNEHVVDIRGSRGRSAAPKVAGGSIAVIVLAAVVSQLLGVDVTGLIGGGGGGGSTSRRSSGPPAPPVGPDPNKELVEFIHFVMKDIQDTFDAMYKADGRAYQHAKLYIFHGAVDTGCGHAGANIGPFYCPADSNAYIDLSFYHDLKKRFGAPGDFAQAYVLAHEIGHHLQNLMRKEGAEPRRISGESKNQHSVRIELQADCFAGIWAKHAQGKGLLEVGDLEEALTAAAAIGDDRLQRQAGVEVQPESFSHGSSEQRVRWFRRGFEGGPQMAACDTFAAATL